MQRADGTYDFPDKEISPFWQREDGLVVKKGDDYDFWVDNKGCTIHKEHGRWLPFLPPKFPERKKTQLRRAKVKIDGKECLAVYSPYKPEYKWVTINNSHSWYSKQEREVVVLEWLDPEFEDE